jgi:hypothetical protein
VTTDKAWLALAHLDATFYPASNSIVYKLRCLRAGNSTVIHLTMIFGFCKFITTQRTQEAQLCNITKAKRSTTQRLNKDFNNPMVK